MFLYGLATPKSAYARLSWLKGSWYLFYKEKEKHLYDTISGARYSEHMVLGTLEKT